MACVRAFQHATLGRSDEAPSAQVQEVDYRYSSALRHLTSAANNCYWQLLHGGRWFNLPFRTRCPDGCAGPRSLGRPLAGRADEMVGGDLIVDLAALIDARSHTNAEIPGYSRPGPRDHAARSKKSGPIA